MTIPYSTHLQHSNLIRDAFDRTAIDTFVFHFHKNNNNEIPKFPSQPQQRNFFPPELITRCCSTLFWLKNMQTPIRKSHIQWKLIFVYYPNTVHTQMYAPISRFCWSLFNAIYLCSARRNDPRFYWLLFFLCIFTRPVLWNQIHGNFTMSSKFEKKNTENLPSGSKNPLSAKRTEEKTRSLL